MKFLGAVAVLLGLSILGFAVMAHVELHAAATSPEAPVAEEMPLTRIVCPELFDPGNAGVKPAELARMAFNRIYMIGGGGLLAATLGGLLFALSLTLGKKQHTP